MVQSSFAGSKKGYLANGAAAMTFQKTSGFTSFNVVDAASSSAKGLSYERLAYQYKKTGAERAEAQCPLGLHVIGGGCEMQPGSVLQFSGPGAERGSIVVANATAVGSSSWVCDGKGTVTAYAICSSHGAAVYEEALATAAGTTVTASCGANMALVGGGCRAVDFPHVLSNYGGNDGDKWECTAVADKTGAKKAYAMCADKKTFGALLRVPGRPGNGLINCPASHPVVIGGGCSAASMTANAPSGSNSWKCAGVDNRGFALCARKDKQAWRVQKDIVVSASTKKLKIADMSAATASQCLGELQIQHQLRTTATYGEWYDGSRADLSNPKGECILYELAHDVLTVKTTSLSEYKSLLLNPALKDSLYTVVFAMADSKKGCVKYGDNIKLVSPSDALFLSKGSVKEGRGYAVTLEKNSSSPQDTRQVWKIVAKSRSKSGSGSDCVKTTDALHLLSTSRENTDGNDGYMRVKANALHSAALDVVTEVVDGSTKSDWMFLDPTKPDAASKNVYRGGNPAHIAGTLAKMLRDQIQKALAAHTKALAVAAAALPAAAMR